MFVMHVFKVFYKSEKNMFLMSCICKSMFLTSMANKKKQKINVQNYKYDALICN